MQKMPSPRKELRASPTTTNGTKPSASPNSHGEQSQQSSEDDRQYMMLRHSDDEDNTGNGNSGTGNNNSNNGGGGGGEQNSSHHVIPGSPDRASASRSISMRGRGDSRGAGTMGPPPAVVARQVTHQYQQQQNQYQPNYAQQPPPMPFRLGGPSPKGYNNNQPIQPMMLANRGPPQHFLRGVSEDPVMMAQATGYPPPMNHSGSYEQQQYNNDPSSQGGANLTMAPSWGSIDMRQGTFDYGESATSGFEHHNGGAPPPPQYGPMGSNVITPAQTIRKSAGGGMSSQQAASSMQSQYMYPPSSPIKGPSPKASPQGSPGRAEEHARAIKLEERPHSGSSEEELAAAWLPPKAPNSTATRRNGNEKRVVEAKAVHIPPPPPVPGAAKPQFMRRQPSHAPKSAAATAAVAGLTVHTGTSPTGATSGTPSPTQRQYVPPLVVDSSRSADSAESPGHSLQGGRVQLVGGGIGENYGAPWNLVSRSRSAEESVGAGVGTSASNEWDPPRTERRPMVPPPGRPANGAVAQAQGTPVRGPGGGTGYPPEYHRGAPHPPQPHPSQYPSYDYYPQQQKSPSGPPAIQQSSSSHSSSSGGTGGRNSGGQHHYPPSSYSPEHAPPSSAGPPGYPGSSPGYPPQGSSPGQYPGGYPEYSPYHSSQYPPGSQYSPQQQYSPYPPGHPGAQRGGPPMSPQEEEEEEEAVHPLLKDYNPHRDGIRPQFTNVRVKKESTASKRSRKAQSFGHGGDAGPDSMCHVGPDGRPLGPPGTPDAATPRRRRRRNPTEKAAAAAAMAAAAAAALEERKEKMTRKRKLDEVKEEAAEQQASNEGAAANTNSGGGATIIQPHGGVAVVVTHEGTAASPFSEEELKTLGSGDDEDIPAAKRAAMASAVALRAAAGGSPLEPPKSAAEVEFDIADPPLSPICPQSTVPVLESATLMTENDVLCGRGGGTNSQMGNRRYRALVRDFQPTYLMAKRREKPRMARSVVLIIRHRGGRFLRRDDSDGRLYEVGDEKAEAKTSQALREGLDVRATKTAANTLMGTTGDGDKKKRKVSPTGAVLEHGAVVRQPNDGGGGRGGVAKAVLKERPLKPHPVHAPGYDNGRPTRPPPPVVSGGAIHPPSGSHPPSAGYYPYPPRYDDPYYQGGRYPPSPAGYDYGPPRHPASHPSSQPPPGAGGSRITSAMHHHFHQYGGQALPPPPPGYSQYPPQYGGYPGYGPPGTPSSHEAAAAPRSRAFATIMGHPGAGYSPPGPPGAPPNLTPIISRPKTLT